jgi:hypothetical protein
MTFTFSKAKPIPIVSTRAGRWIFALDYAGTIQDKFHTQQNRSLGELGLTFALSKLEPKLLLWIIP